MESQQTTAAGPTDAHHDRLQVEAGEALKYDRKRSIDETAPVSLAKRLNRNQVPARHQSSTSARLLGSQITPESARAISFDSPKNESSMPRSAGSKAKRGFKPRDTLNEVGEVGSKKHSAPHAALVVTRWPGACRPANEEPRERASVAEQYPVRSVSVGGKVDLTGEDETVEVLSVDGHNTNSSSRKPGNQSVHTQAPEYFTAREYNMVDSYTHVERGKTSEKGEGTGAVRARNTSPGALISTRPSPQASRPRIQLDRDLDQVQLRQERQSSRDDVSPGTLASPSSAWRAGRLNDTFIRDSPPSKRLVHNSLGSRPRARATQRMMPSSNTTSRRKVSPINDFDDSESADELNGAITVRSKSPLEMGASTESAPTIVPRRTSPSDLPSTNFRKRQPRQERSNRLRPLDLSDNASYRVVRLVTSSYAFSGCESLLIRFDKTQKRFTFERDGTLKESINNVAIELSNGQKTIKRSRNDAKVLVVGSATTLQQRLVCVEFADLLGVDWFIELCEMNRSNIKIERISSEQIQSRFDHLSREVEQWEGKQQLRGRREIAAPDEPNGEESIRYESDESIAATPRKRSQGARLVSQRISGADIETPFSVDSRADLRRSTRNATDDTRSNHDHSPIRRWTVENPLKKWKTSLVYPQTGLRRVTIDFQDLERLDEGEFLNDNVISFALRRIEDNMTLENRSRVHLFSTFFYTALTTKNGRKTFNYDAVKRWTKNIDIFTMPYVVVPINIDLHWFVAIICNLPNLARLTACRESAATTRDGNHVEVVRDSDSSTPAREMSVQSTDVVLAVEEEGNLEASQAKTQPEILELDRKCEIEMDSAPGVSRELPEKRVPDTTNVKKGRTPPTRKFDPTSCVIVTLDSLGASHTAEVRHLKEYIGCEAREKRAIEVDIGSLKGMTAKGIPEQTNFCDCGVYLIGYVEQFAKDPDAFIRKARSRELDRASDFADFDPSAKRAQVRDDVLALYGEQKQQQRKTRTMEVRRVAVQSTENTLAN